MRPPKRKFIPLKITQRRINFIMQANPFTSRKTPNYKNQSPLASTPYYRSNVLRHLTTPPNRYLMISFQLSLSKVQSKYVGFNLLSLTFQFWRWACWGVAASESGPGQRRMRVRGRELRSWGVEVYFSPADEDTRSYNSIIYAILWSNLCLLNAWNRKREKFYVIWRVRYNGVMQ